MNVQYCGDEKVLEEFQQCLESKGYLMLEVSGFRFTVQVTETRCNLRSLKALCALHGANVDYVTVRNK